MQTSAFNREDHRVDGKLHCWLCKLSYKRALAKAKKSDNDKHRHKKRSADEANLKSNSSHKIGSGSTNNRGGNHNSQRPDMSKSGLSEIPEKISKTSGMIPSNSDHVVAMTQLKEQIATLQKRLQQKDNHLLQKDKEVSLKTFFFISVLCFCLHQSIQQEILP
jgi:FAM76 protein